MIGLRITWLAVLSLLFVALVTAIAGPWFALLALVALVVYAIHDATARQRHLAKLAQAAADAQHYADKCAADAAIAQAEAIAAAEQLRMVRESP